MKEEIDKYHAYLNGNDLASEELPADVRQFFEDTKSLKPDGFTKSKNDIWSAIEDQIEDENTSKGEEVLEHTKVINWSKYFGIAAAVLALLVSGVVFFQAQNEVEKQISYATLNQESQNVELPDGSMVYMNAASELSFQDNWKREVKLKGEAFFEVTKGEKFKITTELGEVQVLGTSFNVSVRDGVFAVNCKTGRVQVSFNDVSRNPVVLTRGMGVTLDKGKLKENAVNPQIIGNWKIGEYHYNDRPLIEVLAELERQYNVDIKLLNKDQAMRPYNGYFIKDDLSVALSMVCDPMGLAYEIDNEVVSINK